jgi:hypothetical protein
MSGSLDGKRVECNDVQRVDSGLLHCLKKEKVALQSLLHRVTFNAADWLQARPGADRSSYGEATVSVVVFRLDLRLRAKCQPPRQRVLYQVRGSVTTHVTIYSA